MKEHEVNAGGGGRRSMAVVIRGYALVGAVLALLVVFVLGGDAAAWMIAAAVFAGVVIGDLVWGRRAARGRT